MLRPAAVSAAVAAVWLCSAQACFFMGNSEPDCSQSFYRQTPPQGASAGLLSLCHSLPGGRVFTTVSKPTCGTAVYSAFHLSHGWTDKEGEEPLTNEDIKVPALLRGGGGLSHAVSPTDSPLQRWDSTVTTLVQSSITPQCSTLGGDLYILTGAGGLGASEDGDEECQTEPLWCAVCCSVPEGNGGFSMGLIRETGQGERQVSVKELGEILGVAELFSEGCGGSDGEAAGVRVVLHSEGLPGDLEEREADGSGATEEVGSVVAEEVGSGAIEEVGSGATEEVGSGATEEVTSGTTEEVGSGTTEEVGSGTSEQEELLDVIYSRTVQSESSADSETVDEQETDTNSSSTLVYVLSTTLSILKAPLRPVFSTVTQLPGQVTYVLQEDLGVLSALPGETFSLFHLLTSDVLSWMGTAGETLLDIGGNCCSSIYYCSSSMVGALWDSCHTGVTGVGTLAGDTVGIFGDALDNAWWVTKFFGGQLWEQSEGYVGTVASEMGGQAKAVGGGLGRLVWRSGNGVVNVFRIGGGFIIGMVDMVFGAAREAFGEESE